ncbi:MAG: ATP-binding protein [Acidobacteriota bacterium]|nr:ATP-binding protein [Acidobacteriota bacterium]
MIHRTATATLLRLARGFPILAITGPRQTGKTTLARATFPEKPYLSLEDPDLRDLAEADPRGLLARHPTGAILDEVQRVPRLLSYLQTQVDAAPQPGAFVLTGSQQLEFSSALTQSLAGRVGLVNLLPFSMGELQVAGRLPADLDDLLWRGLYPPLYDRELAPGDWYSAYVSTFVERDLRQLLAVRDLSAFQRFVRLCAARVGQLLNLSSLATDCGITHPTAGAWLSVLEASHLLFLLRPHHRNFNKRLVKTPKLYFNDTGLAAWLLGIRDARQMAYHASRGALFENLVYLECLKARLHAGLPPDLYFWRDSAGLEVDLLREQGDLLHPIEIKSGQTVASDFFEGLRRWGALAGRPEAEAWLVYGGEQALHRGTTTIIPWRDLPGALERPHADAPIE